MNNIILAPLLIFSLAFSTLLLIFSMRKSGKGKNLFFFINFLVVTWIFSAVELANYFNILPPLIESFSTSLLLFLVHYFLLFQYLFIEKYIIESDHTFFRRFFIFFYTIWALYFSLPHNVVTVVDGDNKLLQAVFAFISLSPSILLILIALYKLFLDQLFISKKIFFLLFLGLLIPIVCTAIVIDLQPETSSFSLDLIFICLSISMYFYTFLLYFDEKVKILSSFKEKIVLFVSLLVLIPLTARTMYMYNRTTDILLIEAKNIIEKESYSLVRAIEARLEYFKRNIVVFSQLDGFVRVDTTVDASNEIIHLFIGYLQNNPEVLQMTFIDTQGNEKVKVKQGYEKQIVIPQRELSKVRDAEYIAESFEEVFVSQVFLQRNTDSVIERPYNPIVQLAAPIFAGNKKIGSLVFDLSFKELFAELFSLSSSQIQYAIDSDGYYLQHPDIEKVWGGTDELNTGVSIRTENLALWEAIQSQKSGSILITINGIPYLFAFSPLSVHGQGLGYTLYIVQEKNVLESFAEIEELGFLLVGSSLFASVLTFIVIYMVVNYLVSPLYSLKKAVDNFDSVDESVFPTNSSEEINDLSVAFLNMIKKVKGYQSEIVDQVSQQTEQISENSLRLEKQRAAMINLIEDIDLQRELTLQQATDLKKFKLAIDSVSELIVITDQEGKIIYINPAVEFVTGYTQKEALGSKAGQLWGKQMPKEWYQNFWHVISDRKEKFVDKITNRRKNGDKFIAQITVQPLLDDIGNVQYFVSVQRDITRETQIDRMKTDFISLASHQLRTPLSAMRWFLEMLDNGDFGQLTKEQLDAVDNVSKSNNRMIALVNSLLNISRIESGRIIVNPVSTNVVELVRQVIVSIKDRFDKKNQKIILKADTQIPEISLDPDLTNQVILNLLTNANKYTQNNGNVKVLISKENGYALFQVIDTGLGIPQKEQANIFNRFYRASNVAKNVTDGTGLGLYLARAIVESSGGKIGFRSEEGKGSIFWFTIPLAGVRKKEGEVSLVITK